MKTIEEQIDQLKRETEEKIALLQKQNLLQKKFPEVKISCLKGFTSIEATNKEQAKKILLGLPPTKELEKIKTASKDYEIEGFYEITIINPAKPSQHFDFELKFEFISDEEKYWVTIPLSIVKEFLIETTRNLSDSEYHLFTGVSQKELSSLKLRCYTFKGNKINFYGGNKIALDKSEIDSIIEFILQ